MKYTDVILAIAAERRRQDELVRAGKLPFNCSDPLIPGSLKTEVLGEEFGEVCKASYELRTWSGGPKDALKLALRTELIQLAAVAVAWLESLPE
jgi:hypothetical protein